MGYSVGVTEHGLVWRYGKPGEQEQQSSPGIQELDKSVPGSWRLMPGHDRPAIEWDALDSTHYKGEKHAFTIFIKLSEKAKPMEVVSESYTVPDKPPAPR
jgi:hypothetical protein